MTSTSERSTSEQLQSRVLRRKWEDSLQLPRVLERTYPWFHPQNCLRGTTSETALKFPLRAPGDEGSEHGKGV